MTAVRPGRDDINKQSFDSIEDLIQDIRQGKIVILVDDEDRENEGDLVLAADHVTPAAINFMAAEARGLICLALSSQQIENLQLPLMVREELNHTPNKTAFTVSIEASSGVSTGISAADRAHTIRVASQPKATPADVNRPGHVFPIRAQQGGVLRRAGHTEGSVDLAKLAGLNPAAVICEVMNSDGTMARVPDLISFAKKHGLRIGTIVDLIQYRLQHEALVTEVVDYTQAYFSRSLPNGWKVRIFKNQIDSVEHLVLQKGEFDPKQPHLVRIHIDNFIRDLFANFRTGESLLTRSVRRIDQEGAGTIIILRGFNSPMIQNELKIFDPKPEAAGQGVQVDTRDYGIGAQILRDLGLRKIRLLTNHSDRKVGLKAFDVEIVETIPLTPASENQSESRG
ncbi:MAG: 3,4-dihydroxy-2-butanone-4-phosphate synthase [Bdellovibrionaceae bacterium]|nr:3,4-dihydroxy-2-butanone-4-phosphate synthase [Pseudobdellovibrionaceae bacterium]